MLKLTENQFEKAVEAYYKAGIYGHLWDTATPATKYRIGEQLRAAAPFLQAPLDAPTDKEVADLYTNIVNVGSDLRGIRHTLTTFIEGRNLDLLPKPVDPRREKIVAVLGRTVMTTNEGLADRILAAIDGRDGER